MAAKRTPKGGKASNYIKSQHQLFRITTDLNKFRNAVITAENWENPNRQQLYELYQQTMLDAHVTACWAQAKNMILGSRFCVYQQGSDKEDEQRTKLIRKRWFPLFLDLALDAKMWGHSLPQFDDIINRDGTDEFKDVELVPRQYVSPEFQTIIAYPGSPGYNGKDFTDAPVGNWCIGIGSKRDLGTLLKLTPLVIWKKNAMGAWAEYIEKFGSPIRIGKTDSSDEKSVMQMENMLKNMSVASWGLFKTDDIIEIKADTRTDAYEVYDKMIDRCNSEISKLILGQTMTTDDGSSRSQAEVHERVLKQVGDSLRQFIYSVLNDQLVPLLNYHGFGLDGCYIDVEQEDEWDLEQKGKFDVELLKTGKFSFTPEYIKEKYGTEVVPVEEPEPDDDLKKYKNVLSKYYT